MLRRMLCLFMLASLVLPALFATPAQAGDLQNVKVALHLQSRSAKGICDHPDDGGFAPYLVPLSQYVTEGLVGTSYNAYLIAAGGPGVPLHGIAALSCGVDYDPVPAQGVDVFDWIHCGDLEFPNAGPNGVWPAAGGGNRITFDISESCPSRLVPGFEVEGFFTIFGAFYVYAYGDDFLEVTENENLVSGPELAVGDCAGSESDLLEDAGGFVAFSADGSTLGCNPLYGACTGTSPPQCQVIPDSLDFGAVAVGNHADRSFTLTNTGGLYWTGVVSAGCGDFVVTSGSGYFSLATNESRIVNVRYLPQTEGAASCDLPLGSIGCSEVPCTGIGLPGTPSACEVNPTALDFGEVWVGVSAERTFTITNVGGSYLSGAVSANCPEFSIVSGGGAYELAAGQSHTVTVRYEPLVEAPAQCMISLGAVSCPGVACDGVGIPIPDCTLSRDVISFGGVEIGWWKTRGFSLTNRTAVPLDVLIWEDSSGFTIMTGGGNVTVQPGASHEVMVVFTPGETRSYSGTIHIDGGCGSVAVSGRGDLDDGSAYGTQPDAVVALHAQSRAAKAEEVCTSDPVTAATPCDSLVSQWSLNGATDVYLVVAQGDPSLGIAALTCGIIYNGWNLGEGTATDGVGVDIHSWTSCTSGLQFFMAPYGLPEAEWPASGGSLRITWDKTADCQRTELGDYGVHAVAGAFYVFAYSDDVLQVTGNNNAPSGPEFQVGDCGISLTDLPTTHAGSVGFGTPLGFNPCINGGPVPIKLLSFTADRDGDGAVLRWKTGAATADHLGFEVHRQTDLAGRELISDGLLSGRTDYAFTDPAPPLGETEYWLAERSREGSITWHGPAILPAGTISGGRLAMTQPPTNPFVTSTQFSFRLPEGGEVRVSIYDMMGREVARPFSGTLSPGEQVVSWDGRDDRGRRLSAGAYIYRVDTENGSLSGKVVRLQ